MSVLLPPLPARMLPRMAVELLPVTLLFPDEPLLLRTPRLPGGQFGASSPHSVTLHPTITMLPPVFPSAVSVPETIRSPASVTMIEPPIAPAEETFTLLEIATGPVSDWICTIPPATGLLPSIGPVMLT